MLRRCHMRGYRAALLGAVFTLLLCTAPAQAASSDTSPAESPALSSARPPVLPVADAEQPQPPGYSGEQAPPGRHAAPEDDARGGTAVETMYSPEYQVCMDKAEGVATAVQDCMDTEYQRLEKLIVERRTRLLNILHQERGKALTEALTAWEALRLSGSAAMYDPEGGTYSPLMAALWHLDQTARMARWLEDLQHDAAP